MLLCSQYNVRLLSYCIVYFDIKLISKVVMSYLSYRLLNWAIPITRVYSMEYAIFLTNWSMSCDWVWLAWLQLSYWDVVFKYWLASNGAFTGKPCWLVTPGSYQLHMHAHPWIVGLLCVGFAFILYVYVKQNIIIKNQWVTIHTSLSLALSSYPSSYG